MNLPTNNNGTIIISAYESFHIEPKITYSKALDLLKLSFEKSSRKIDELEKKYNCSTGTCNTIKSMILLDIKTVFKTKTFGPTPDFNHLTLDRFIVEKGVYECEFENRRYQVTISGDQITIWFYRKTNKQLFKAQGQLIYSIFKAA